MLKQKWKLIKWGKHLVSACIICMIAVTYLGTVSATVSDHKESNLIWIPNSVTQVKKSLESQCKTDNLAGYIVQWGDTLSTISQASGISIDYLVKQYNIINPNYIIAGYSLAEQSQFNQIMTRISENSYKLINQVPQQSAYQSIKSNTDIPTSTTPDNPVIEPANPSQQTQTDQTTQPDKPNTDIPTSTTSDKPVVEPVD